MRMLVMLRLHARDSTAKDFATWGHYTQGVVVVRPGETKPLTACLDGTRPNCAYLQKHLSGVREYPGMFERNFWRTLDASQVAAVRLTVVGTSAQRGPEMGWTVGGPPAHTPVVIAVSAGERTCRGDTLRLPVHS